MEVQTQKRLRNVQSNILKIGSKCEYIVHDISVNKDVKKMIDLTIKSFGRIDVLICNAGISYRSIFEYVNIDVFEKLFKINFLALYTLSSTPFLT